jgi:lysophospholipase L1-like esterase
VIKIAFFGDSLTRGFPGSSALTLLRERLPDQYSLANFGRVNDTVIGLYRRISGLSFDEPFDAAFVWIGVNDVVTDAPWAHKAMTALLGQRRPRNLGEFRFWYEATLALVSRHALRVFAVSPAVRGENLDNGWNDRLVKLSAIIEDVASRVDRAEYLNLQAIFARELAGRPTTRTLPGSALRVAFDWLTARSQEQIDRRATARGLHLTLDGIHLNSAGAELAAYAFAETIAAPTAQVVREGSASGRRGVHDRL